MSLLSRWCGRAFRGSIPAPRRVGGLRDDRPTAVADRDPARAHLNLDLARRVKLRRLSDGGESGRGGGASTGGLIGSAHIIMAMWTRGDTEPRLVGEPRGHELTAAVPRAPASGKDNIESRV